jgi:hypothetical protein
MHFCSYTVLKGEQVMTTKTGPSSDNRRQFMRVVPERHAPVRVHINGEDFIEVTNALDIGEGGIRISVGHRFAGCQADLPALVIVYLPAPINQHFRVRGQIKHVLGDSFGVEFANLSSADLAIVRRYIKLRAKETSSPTNFFGFFRKLFRPLG